MFNAFLVSLLSLISFNCFSINKKFSEENSSKKNESIETYCLKQRGETLFSGSATSVEMYETKSDLWWSPYVKYYRFLSPMRGFVSFNYSGPPISLTTYYSNYFLNTDYLSKSSSYYNEPDCYYFDKNVEYIIELKMIGTSTTFYYSFCMELLDINLSNHEKYILHEEIDSDSNVGVHYNVSYFNTGSSGYSPHMSNIVSSSSTTSYLDNIDSTHNFGVSGDNRRLVSDTRYYEYSSIGYFHTSFTYFKYNTSSNKNTIVDSLSYRGTGTFISNNCVLSCAHLFYDEDFSSTKQYSALCRTGTFYPGVNTYSSFDSYGYFYITNIYLPVDYILKYDMSGVYPPYWISSDWALVIVDSGHDCSLTHSSMGLSSFNNTTYDAISAGYPHLTNCPASDVNIYSKTLWVSYPLGKEAHINTFLNGMSYIESANNKTTQGNSGGPLYINSTYVEYGQVYHVSSIIGICSCQVSLLVTEGFFQITSFHVNLAKEIMNIYA